MTSRPLLIALAIVAGCDDSVRIVGTCEIDTAAMRVGGPVDGTPFAAGAIAIEGSSILVSWSEWGAGSGFPPTDGRRLVQWVDAQTLEPIGEPASLGTTDAVFYRLQWVRSSAGLTAQVWADPEGVPQRPQDTATTLQLWTLDGPEGPRARIPIHVSTMRPGCVDCPVVEIGNAGASAGFHGVLPTAVAGGTTWAGMAAAPSACGWGYGDEHHFRLLLARSDGAEVTASPTLGDNDPCLPHSTDDSRATSGDVVSNPWLIPVDEGVGVLYRVDFHAIHDASGAFTRADEEGRVYFRRFSADGNPHGGARRVGRYASRGATLDGHQPRGVTVPGGILFTELASTINECQLIRVARSDGTEAEDAPWQLPCVGGSRVVSGVDLVPISGGAAIVWSERSPTPDISVSAGFTESVRVALLTPEGQRGSEILTVTDVEATTLSTGRIGAPGEFFPDADSEGDRVAVIWRDTRAFASGLYARIASCRIDR